MGSAPDASALLTTALGAPWDERIGPCYDTAALVRILGVNRQAIAEGVRRHSILAARTRKGRLVYPAFQVDGPQVLPTMSPILRVFRRTPWSGWSLAAWFTTPAAALGETTPAQWLREGRDVGPIRALAEDAARGWAW